MLISVKTEETRSVVVLAGNGLNQFLEGIASARPDLPIHPSGTVERLRR